MLKYTQIYDAECYIQKSMFSLWFVIIHTKIYVKTIFEDVC